MRGGVLPLGLLFAALGLALGCAPRGDWRPGFLALLGILGAFAFLPVPKIWLEGVYLACWTGVIATALSVYFIHRSGRWVALALSLNAGIVASAVVCVSGSRFDLLKALPCMLMMFPASWLVGRGVSIPVKVVSSWIVAVAVLAAALQLLPVTPGYLPDHLE
jgi:hypothetical protein